MEVLRVWALTEYVSQTPSSFMSVISPVSPFTPQVVLPSTACFAWKRRKIKIITCPLGFLGISAIWEWKGGEYYHCNEKRTTWFLYSSEISQFERNFDSGVCVEHSWNRKKKPSNCGCHAPSKSRALTSALPTPLSLAVIWQFLSSTSSQDNCFYRFCKSRRNRSERGIFFPSIWTIMQSAYSKSSQRPDCVGTTVLY